MQVGEKATSSGQSFANNHSNRSRAKWTPITPRGRHPHRCDYLVPGAEDPSGEHEQVAHGDQTGPDEQGEEAQHPLEDWLDADQDEDGQEEEEGGGDRDEERQVVLNVLGAEGGGGKETSKQALGLSPDTSEKRHHAFQSICGLKVQVQPSVVDSS